MTPGIEETVIKPCENELFVELEYSNAEPL